MTVTTMSDDRLDAAFAAWRTRPDAPILSRLARGDATVGELADPFDMSLPGISKHLKVLERSGLISRRRAQRPVPALPPRTRRLLDGALDWIAAHRRLWGERFDKLDAPLADLQHAPERTGPEQKGRGRNGSARQGPERKRAEGSGEGGRGGRRHG